MKIFITEVEFFCGAAWKDITIEITASSKEEIISTLQKEMAYVHVGRTIPTKMYEKFLMDYNKSDKKLIHEEYFLKKLEKYLDFEVYEEDFKLPIIKYK